MDFCNLCLLFALYLGIQTWIRMNKNRKIALWESFRFLIILLIILTLFNPMRVEELESSEKSQIVCLQDISESMQTKDVIINDNEPIKRSSWTKQFLKEDWIENLENNASVLLKISVHHSGAKATDISNAVRNTIDQTESLKAILLLTDGNTNTGTPFLSVGGKSRALSIPVYSIITGSDSSLPDLSLDEVFAPSFVLQEERVTINWQGRQAIVLSLPNRHNSITACKWSKSGGKNSSVLLEKKAYQESFLASRSMKVRLNLKLF